MSRVWRKEYCEFMIKIEHVVLASPEQMEFIIEGMRNPFNSWNKSDSYAWHEYMGSGDVHLTLGGNDRSLMQRLSNAGTDHRKYMRMMPVYVRITAPLYWWKEFDTYKVATVSNSCSTMHKIDAKKFVLDDFSYEHLINNEEITYPSSGGGDDEWGSLDILDLIMDALNHYRDLYLRTKDKKYWWQMIQLLPSSYNQTRNVFLNYEVLANIYKSRKNHKLDEWRELCKWIESLPYSELITGEDNG